MPDFRSLLKLSAFLIASWLFIHFLVIFGPFVALAYPVWWLFSPSKINCLICYASQPGSYCHFCRRTINKSTLSPRTLVSAFFNALIIATLTLISVGLVYSEERLISQKILPYYSGKSATMNVDVDQNIYLNQEFALPLELNNLSRPINALTLDLQYDPEALQVTGISMQDSFLTIVLDEVVNTITGYIRISGGVPNPGYTEESGLVATVNFRSLRPGLTSVSLLPTSRVLAHDGKGTDIFSDKHKTFYLLVLPEYVKEGEDFPGDVKGVFTQERAEAESSVVLNFADRSAVLGTATEAAVLEQAAQEVTTTNPSSDSLWLQLLDFLHFVDRIILKPFTLIRQIFARS